jgi:CrcB protein
MDVALSLLIVALMGGLGSSIRYVIGSWKTLFPWGILLANSAASFIAGLVVGNGLFELALLTGFAGGLSTFSTFAAQTFELWTNRSKALALLNGALNLVLPAVLFITAVIWL